MSSIEEVFRRMVFNIIARNQDDHVKNIAFLMDKSGTWSLAPAFDIIYSFNPSGTWTASHQMTLNGKRDDFTLEDFKACARAASMKRGRAETIIKEVREKVDSGTDPAEIARLTFQALKAGCFYIVPHVETCEGLENRFEAIMKDFKLQHP